MSERASETWGRAIFITGTDTGVGKTHVCVRIAQELSRAGASVGAYKPVCSGAEVQADGRCEWDDLRRLAAAFDPPPSLDALCAQRFLAPLAPPIAARREGRSVDVDRVDTGLRACLGAHRHVIVEGAGGWLCPLTETQTLADWAQRWAFPVLIVARRGLGTINHTLLTVESIRARGLSVAGVVLNQAIENDDDNSAADNADEIEKRSGVPFVLELGHGPTRRLLRHKAPVTMDWSNLFHAVGSSDSLPQGR